MPSESTCACADGSSPNHTVTGSPRIKNVHMQRRYGPAPPERRCGCAGAVYATGGEGAHPGSGPLLMLLELELPARLPALLAAAAQTGLVRALTPRPPSKRSTSNRRRQSLSSSCRGHETMAGGI